MCLSTNIAVKTCIAAKQHATTKTLFLHVLPKHFVDLSPIFLHVPSPKDHC